MKHTRYLLPWLAVVGATWMTSANALPFPNEDTLSSIAPDFFNAYGTVVDIEGDQILVSGPEDNIGLVGQTGGTVFLYDRHTGELERTIISTREAGGNFGYAAQLDDGRVVVGSAGVPFDARAAGKVQIFDASSGDLLIRIEDPDDNKPGNFGRAVGLDGNNLVVGARSNDIFGQDAGRAYIFDADSGNLRFTLDDPTPSGFDLYGFSVATDNGLALIGEPNDSTNGLRRGQAHLYDANTGALLFTYNDPDTLFNNDRFGFSVALEGEYAVVGARDSGQRHGEVFVFSTQTGALLQTFEDPTPSNSDQFGRSVAIDGNHLLVGAPGDDTQGPQVGQAYLFNLLTGDLLQIFDDSTVTDGDLFGTSVAIDGDALIVGARFDDTHDTGAGQAHVFGPGFDVITTTAFEPTSFALAGVLAVMAFYGRRTPEKPLTHQSNPARLGREPHAADLPVEAHSEPHLATRQHDAHARLVGMRGLLDFERRQSQMPQSFAVTIP